MKPPAEPAENPVSCPTLECDLFPDANTTSESDLPPSMRPFLILAACRSSYKYHCLAIARTTPLPFAHVVNVHPPHRRTGGKAWRHRNIRQGLGFRIQ